jgi:2-methylcitrate dehydratase PrpD
MVGQAGMDAMYALVIEHEIKPEMVDHIKVTTGSYILPPNGPLRYKKAQTPLEAKFCVPFQMVSMIIRRKAGMMEFSKEFVQSPAVQDMMDRVETNIDPRLDAAGRNKYIFMLEVRLKDGNILQGKSPGQLRGGPQKRLKREEIQEKFYDCVQWILNPDQSRRLLETIESLEDLDHIGILIEQASVP